MLLRTFSSNDVNVHGINAGIKVSKNTGPSNRRLQLQVLVTALDDNQDDM